MERDNSTFVTVLAWIFIIFSGFQTLISILQNVTLALTPAVQVPQASQEVPKQAQFILSNVHLFFASFLILSIVNLTAAFGLLKRKNWARIFFILLMSLGILSAIPSLVIQFVFTDWIPKVSEGAETEELRSIAVAIQVFGTTVIICFIILLSWIIKKLVSSTIRAEFKA